MRAGVLSPSWGFLFLKYFCCLTLRVSLAATMADEEGPQLLTQEIASERVVWLDDVLAVKKRGVYRNKIPFVE